MNKRYAFKINKKLNIALYILLSVLVAGIIANVVLMSLKLSAEESLNVIPNIISLVFTVLAFSLTLTLKVALFYTLSDKGFKLTYLFAVSKVKYDDILLIRESESENLTLMYHKSYTKTGTEQVTYIALCIDPKLLNDFFQTVKSYNSNVVFESYDKIKEEMENEINDNH